MKDFTKRMERMKADLAVLKRQKMSLPTLVYADGSRRSMGIIEAVKEIGTRDDIVDVLSPYETTSSLLRGMLGPWDFSDIEELAEFF